MLFRHKLLEEKSTTKTAARTQKGFIVIKVANWKALTMFAISTALATAACGQTFQTLVNFSGPNGYLPSYEMSLTQGPDGDLYGTTYYGGVNNDGTFFKMTPDGMLTVLYSFDSTAAYPVSGVALGTDGSFYGTTIEGGTNGWGAVFRITPTGAITILHSFNISDGCIPYGTPVEGIDGNFYGTTQYGGGNADGCYQGSGTVYKVTSAGTFTTLHLFEGYQDGGGPWAGDASAGPDREFLRHDLRWWKWGIGEQCFRLVQQVS